MRAPIAAFALFAILVRAADATGKRSPTAKITVIRQR